MGLAAALAGCAASPDPDSLSFDPLEEQNREAHALNKEIDASLYGPVARSYGEAVPQPRPAAPSRTCATTGACRGRSSSTGCRAAAPTRRSRPPASRSTRSSASAASSTSPPTWASPTTRPTSTRSSTAGASPRAAISSCRWSGRAPSATGRATCSTSSSTRPGTCCRSRRRTRSSCSGGLDLVNDRYELDPVLDSLLYESRRQLHRPADRATCRTCARG